MRSGSKGKRENKKKEKMTADEGEGEAGRRKITGNGGRKEIEGGE